MKKIAHGVLLPFSAWVFVALLTRFVFATGNTPVEFKASLFFGTVAALLLIALSITSIFFRLPSRPYVPSWLCAVAGLALFISFAFDTETESHM
jgi:hypothetical protein